MLFAGLGRSVLGKTMLSVLSMALGPRPWAVLDTSGTGFLNTDLLASQQDTCSTLYYYISKLVRAL